MSEETLTGKAALAEKARKRLRIKSRTADIDDEIDGLVASALDDMTARYIDAKRLCPDDATASEMAPLAVRAVMLYVKAHFGMSRDKEEAARYMACYDTLTQSMALTSLYRIGG